MAIDSGGRDRKSGSVLPAVLPVNYFRASSKLTARDAAFPVDECEPGCLPIASDYDVGCYGCDARWNYWYSNTGGCGQISYPTKTCTIPETGEEYTCQYTDVRICIDVGPPPSPPPWWPTPTPTPIPECTSCSSDAQCPCDYMHCNLHIGFCVGNYPFGCNQHFVDDCWDSGGYVPVNTCDCSHYYGFGGGGGGGGGCYFSDCSCDPGGSGWECDTGFCMGDGYCLDAMLDPILINVGGGDFKLTSAANGVMFDFFGRGAARQMSWTDRQSNDAWLVLDWNKNGKIDSGKEMFSNTTPERESTDSPLGFKALAMFDTRSFGGNSDGAIDQRDPVFRRLRLWQDVNHDGISDPGELHTLPELGVESISLEYKESRRRDRWGNEFRYRAKVYGPNHNDLGRWAYDVVLLSARDSIGQVADLQSSEIDRRVAGMNMFRIFGHIGSNQLVR